MLLVLMDVSIIAKNYYKQIFVIKNHKHLINIALG